MTTTVDNNQNSRVRKTLASQLDRLDQILDGLADGLNQAVASAVQEAVRQAVEQAVAGVLTEILTNPTLVDRLRGAAPAPAPERPRPEAAPCPPCPAGPLQRAQGWLLAGWSRARQAVSSVVRSVTTAAVRTCACLRNSFRRAGVVPLVVAAAAGAVLGYLAGPQVMVVVTGAAAGLAARGSQFVGWLRRGWAAWAPG